MPVPNPTLDLTAEELATVRATDAASHDATTATPTNDEAAALGLLFRALRGRGVRRPLSELLGVYHDPLNKAASFDPAFIASDPAE